MRVGHGRSVFPIASRRSVDLLTPPSTHDAGVTACLIEGRPETVLLLAADVLAHTSEFAKQVRMEVAVELGLSPNSILLSATHTHASLWPGRSPLVQDANVSSESSTADAAIRQVYVAAAIESSQRLTRATPQWTQGHAPGLSTNRRERTPKGMMIGRFEAGYCDDTVTTLAFASPDSRSIATVVGFACHPVVCDPTRALSRSDFVGELRTAVSAFFDGGCLFLQGASGDIQPIDSLNESGDEKSSVFGRRIAAESIRSVALSRVPGNFERGELERWTPTAIYRSAPTQEFNDTVRLRSTTIRLPLSAVPTPEELMDERARLVMQRADVVATAPNATMIRRGLDNQIVRIDGLLASGPLEDSVEFEIWVAQLGDGALVGVSGELFAEIARDIRESSPFGITYVAGVCNGVVGYIPTAAEFPLGGFEVTQAHWVYGQPSAVSPTSGSLITEAASKLLNDLWRDATRT